MTLMTSRVPVIKSKQHKKKKIQIYLLMWINIPCVVDKHTHTHSKMALNLPLRHTLLILFSLSITITTSLPSPSPVTIHQDSPPYLWPLPAEFTSGEETLSMDPSLSLTVAGNGGGSPIVRAAFDRYMGMIFKHAYNRASSLLTRIRFLSMVEYDITSLKIIVHSDSEEVK